MKRLSQIVFYSDAGRGLVKLPATGNLATIEVCAVSADELDELAVAASAAADELRARVGAEKLVGAE